MFSNNNTASILNAPKRRFISLPFEERGDNEILARVHSSWGPNAEIDDIFGLKGFDAPYSGSHNAGPYAPDVHDLTSTFATVNLNKRHSVPVRPAATTSIRPVGPPQLAPVFKMFAGHAPRGLGRRVG